MNIIKPVTWYIFFNNNNHFDDNKLNPKSILLNCETIYPNNIIIAKKQKNNWNFAKFISLKHFITYFDKCLDNYKTFYAVLTHETRYLYLDIDYYLLKKLSIGDKNELIQKITNILQTFVNCHGYEFGIRQCNLDFLVWDATRENKFSIHLIETNQIMHYKDIKNFVNKLNIWIKENGLLDPQCKFDNNVYHEKYQLWRLPYNHNGNSKSVLKLYNKNLNIEKQFRFNIMHQLRNIKKACHCSNLQQNYSTTKYTNENFNDNNNINIPNTIINKIKDMFKINHLRLNQSKEYVINKHYCVIGLRVHNNNSARIKILKIKNYENIYYCIYTCMKESCREIQGNKYISLCNEFKRPWLFIKFIKLPINILKELDEFINLLITKHVITFKNTNCTYKILKYKKLRFNEKNYIFSTFFHDNVLHNTCQKNNLHIYYKNGNCTNIIYGPMTLYCAECSNFINLRNKQLIH